jgi:DNA-binding MarR family transcriptional regulator
MIQRDSKWESLIREFRSFNRFFTNLIGLLNQHILNSPFSLAEARILMEIGNHPDCTATVLIQLLRIDAGYLSRILNRLEHNKLIDRKKSLEDGRSRILYLTEKGEEELSIIHEKSDLQIQQLIQGLSLEKLTDLVEHMKAVEAILLSATNTSK